MAIQTYITSTEANLLYNNDASFTPAQRAAALSGSFGLVNSYVAMSLTVPSVGSWDGESTITAPWCLKAAQGAFYQWLLERGNVGETDELRTLYDSTAERLRGLKQSDLSDPSQQVYEQQAGWHVVGITSAESKGAVYVEGTPPTFRVFYRLVVKSTAYAKDGISVDVYRSDSATSVKSITAYLETAVQCYERDGLCVRFDGHWTTNDEIRVAGVPHTDVNATKGTPIKQGPLSY